MHHVVVTGASTGIGYATTKLLTLEGCVVYGTVRHQTDADKLRTELGEHYIPLRLDVTDERQIKEAVAVVRQHLGMENLWGLVNNAGIGVGGPLTSLAVERFRYQLEVNLVGVMAVTQAFLPLLGLDPSRTGSPGRIVNIGSISGRLAGPFMGAYSASKFGLEGFSDSLRRELIKFGIDVILIEPGPVKTPIWQKSEAKLLEDFPDTPFTESLEKFRDFAMQEAKTGFDPEKIASIIFDALRLRHPRPRYMPVPRKLINWTIPSLLPTRVLDRLMARFLHLR